MNGDVHVAPINDDFPHVAQRSCPCGPYFDKEKGVIVHVSFDGRELMETPVTTNVRCYSFTDRRLQHAQ